MRVRDHSVRLPRGAYAVLDQAFASLASVGAVLAVLATAGRQELGLLLWMLAPTYLLIGLQNALVTSPYLTLIAGLDTVERDRRRTTAGSLGLLLVAAGSGLVGVGVSALWLAGDRRFDPSMAISFAMGVAGLLLREQERAFAYAHQSVSKALGSTLTYFGLLVFGLALAALTIGIGARLVFALMGVAGFGAALLSSSSHGSFAWLDLRVEAVSYLRLARWAVVGVCFAWILGSAYPIYIERRFGLLEVAEAGVARLWLMPVALLVPAFVNFFRPKIAEMIAIGQVAAANKIVGKVVLTVVGSSIVPLLAAALLNQTDILATFGWRLPSWSYLAAWAVYFFLFAARSMAQIFMLGDERGYRQLSFFSFVAFLLVISLLAIVPGDSGYALVLLMAFVEGLLALMVMRSGRERTKDVSS